MSGEKPDVYSVYTVWNYGIRWVEIRYGRYLSYGGVPTDGSLARGRLVPTT